MWTPLICSRGELFRRRGSDVGTQVPGPWTFLPTRSGARAFIVGPTRRVPSHALGQRKETRTNGTRHSSPSPSIVVSGERRHTVQPKSPESPLTRPHVGDRSRHRKHRRYRRVHDAGGPSRCRHDGYRRAGRDRRRSHALGRAVRSAHQADPKQRRRPVRVLTTRVRRLRRLPRWLVLLDPGLGGQRRHRGVVGLLRGRVLQPQPSERA